MSFSCGRCLCIVVCAFVSPTFAVPRSFCVCHVLLAAQSCCLCVTCACGAQHPADSHLSAVPMRSLQARRQRWPPKSPVRGAFLPLCLYLLVCSDKPLTSHVPLTWTHARTAYRHASAGCIIVNMDTPHVMCEPLFAPSDTHTHTACLSTLRDSE